MTVLLKVFINGFNFKRPKWEKKKKILQRNRSKVLVNNLRVNFQNWDKVKTYYNG
jgi:hypothetical protein